MEVKPNMLCWLVNRSGDLLPGNENMVVEAVRRLTPIEQYPMTENAWLVSSRDPMKTFIGHSNIAFCIERNLQPINDPDADIGTETHDELPGVLREPGTV